MATRKVQMNVLVLPETKENIEAMAKMAFRGMGDQVDWMVDRIWSEMKGQENAPVTDGEKTEAA